MNELIRWIRERRVVYSYSLFTIFLKVTLGVHKTRFEAVKKLQMNEKEIPRLSELIVLLSLIPFELGMN